MNIKLYTLCIFLLCTKENCRNNDNSVVSSFILCLRDLRALSHVRITPILIDALGTLSNNLQKYLEDLHIGLSIQSSEISTVLLGSEGIDLLHFFFTGQDFTGSSCFFERLASAK